MPSPFPLASLFHQSELATRDLLRLSKNKHIYSIYLLHRKAKQRYITAHLALANAMLEPPGPTPGPRRVRFEDEALLLESDPVVWVAHRKEEEQRDSSDFYRRDALYVPGKWANLSGEGFGESCHPGEDDETKQQSKEAEEEGEGELNAMTEQELLALPDDLEARLKVAEMRARKYY